MKEITLSKLFLIAAAAFALAAGTASGMSSGPFLSNCGKHVTKPKTFTISCADANYMLVKLTWSSWGGKTAAGGGMARVNSCTPNCAAGKFKNYPVKVTASNIKACKGHKDYTKLAILYTALRPHNIGKTDIHAIKCD
jgi:hypothetical protein